MNEDSLSAKWNAFRGKHPFITFTLFAVPVVWFFAAYIPSTAKWDGKGAVSLFPQASDAKNYRLDADISVSRKLTLTGYDEYYTIDKAYWPNGGWASFSSCTVKKDQRQECLSNQGDDYFVELSYAPEPPETSSDN